MWKNISAYGIFLAAVSVGVNVVSLIPTLYFLQVYDRVLPGRSVETLFMLGTLCLIAILLSYFLERLRDMLITDAGRKFFRRLLPAAFSEQLNSADNHGQQSHLYFHVNTLKDFMCGPALLSLIDAPWAFVYLLIIWLFHPLLGALTLFGLALIFLIALHADNATGKIKKELALLQRKEKATFNGYILNREVLHTFGVAKKAEKHYLTVEKPADSAHSQLLQSISLHKNLSKSARQLLQSSLVGVGAWLVIQGSASPGVMLAATILLGKALQPAEQFFGSWRHFLQVREAWPNIQASWTAMSTPQIAKLNLPRPVGHLIVHSLSWAYQIRGKMILRNLSLAAHPGELLVISGNSATGKSTLCRLLTGVFIPFSGTVTLDGTNVSTFPREQIGSSLGFLPQQGEVVHGSVAFNICRFDEAHLNDSAAIVAASLLADAHNMILGFPQGYDTILGPTGYPLSLGQKQRIALARAYFGDPCVLVLDEPSAHLDSPGQYKLVETLTRLRKAARTIIVISQEPEIVSIASRSLMLRGGSLEALGPPRDSQAEPTNVRTDVSLTK